MKNKKTALLLAVCLSLGTLAGCSTEEINNYRQAELDLADGNFQTALEEYETAVSDGIKVAESYRGAGVANVRLGNYEAAIEDFTQALNCEKVGKALKKDILSYRAAAYLKTKSYEEALTDCQALAEGYDMDADLYFLSGEVALAMDSYEEAASYFEQAYGEDATYDMAIRIYAVYLEQDMEADGTRYLEAALSGEAKNAQDHCDRGRVYYYMDDYDNASEELKQAIDGGNTEAMALLGMVYMEQKDTANARSCSSSMYLRQKTVPKATMVWHYATLRTETMTVLFPISAVAFQRQMPKTCRVFCLMKWLCMRRNWTSRQPFRKRKNI